MDVSLIVSAGIAAAGLLLALAFMPLRAAAPTTKEEAPIAAAG
jgi:hypothetical protein